MVTLKAVPIATGLSRPVFATAAPGDASRLFIVEQAGRIRVLNLATRAVQPVPYLELPTAALSHGNEQGLLGLAFHPKYRANGFFPEAVFEGPDHPHWPVDDQTEVPG